VEFGEPEDFGPLDAAIAQLQQLDWMIFTSGQAVRAFVARSKDLGASLNPAETKLRIAAVGPVCAEAVRQAGLPVEYVARTHSGVGLANELGETVAGPRRAPAAERPGKSRFACGAEDARSTGHGSSRVSNVAAGRS